MSFSVFLYKYIFIPVSYLLLPVLGLFLPKLKERHKAYASCLSSLDKLDSKSRRIWFHASSMGEFEQAKPIIEEIKRADSNIQIIVSFYSPSGYNNQKDYQFADAVLYMPFDTKNKAKKFIQMLNPSTAVFIRYEFWLNHLEELRRQNIPAYLVCATIPGRETPKNRISLSFYRSALNFFAGIYTVGEKHTAFFNSLGPDINAETYSDTRFDRIIEKVEDSRSHPLILEGFLSENDFVLVAGSSWEEDEDLIIEAMKLLEKDGIHIKVVFVPHEPTTTHIDKLKDKLDSSVLLSRLLQTNDFTDRPHVIVDSIGKLLRLYSHADAAYIGGAFGAGVHSVTEPAGYGIPLATGPGMDNSPDAVNLKNNGALTVTADPQQLYEWLKSIINDKNKRNTQGEKAREYVYSRKGSSKAISDIILNSVKELS